MGNVILDRSVLEIRKLTFITGFCDLGARAAVDQLYVGGMYKKADKLCLLTGAWDTEVEDILKSKRVNSEWFFVNHTITALNRECDIIIEFPENKLHPFSQRAFADTIMKYVNRHRNIVVRTHSDHFINSARIAIKKNELRSDWVSINHFNDNGVWNIEINKNGVIDYYPEYFMSQHVEDLDEILGS